MDALKAELALKRKTLDILPVEDARPAKYMRRGDIERLKEEQERMVREENLAREREENEKIEAEQFAILNKEQSTARSVSGTPNPDIQRDAASPDPSSSTIFNISNEEAIRRLRAKGQPIRLFSESDRDRRLRLRALELIEEKEHERQGGQNDFRKALEDVETRAQKDINESAKQKEGRESKDVGGEVLDLDLVKTDPNKLYPIIYYALKRTLKEWGEWMDDRPEHVKRTTQGKLAAATQHQSAEYLKPLFKLLRSRSLPPDMLARVAEIVHYMQKRQYQKANDSYLRLSIGNAPWPIGVTMVGIHERSAREKISADQVAHVLNDEVSRKYIQSLKRLLTFSQTKYPPEDVTQLMG
ncbi:pre-mRNA splicing factor [Irpex rosettiformis]|uniref:Pre-mRNA splicing factor n=1 Tax=Irpex rosettiformis TaxID=378272 RepID=A0ACB8TQ80_9APHY|nr:pre-mRNA splicing factor [Irpex rosettiformis]